MQLFSREYGSKGPPLVILHGLFGNQGNWAWQARQLAEHYRVIGVDLRNHGRSAHAEGHDYPLMAADLLETLDKLDLATVHLLGHSMGGKVAMEFALQNPDRLSSLVVVDIAPVAYPPEDYIPLKALNAVDLDHLQDRADAAAVLYEYLETEEVVEFLLTSLYRNSDGKWAWRFNLKALTSHYDDIRAWSRHERTFEKPVIFIKGAESDYITSGARGAIMQQFPQARLKVITSAGHWPHSEKPQAFLKVLTNFLQQH